MPVSLLIALFLAFGTDSIFPPAPAPRGPVVLLVLEAMSEVGLVGLVGLAFATAVAIRVRVRGRRAANGEFRATSVTNQRTGTTQTSRQHRTAIVAACCAAVLVANVAL